MHSFYTRGMRQLYEFRFYLLVAVIVFAFAVVSGYLSAVGYPRQAGTVIQDLSDLVHSISEYENWQLFLFIFFNNGIKVFLAMVLGVLFALFPLFFLLVNGYVLGIIAFIVEHERGGLGPFLAGILPHGVLEIPAVLFGSGLGIFLGVRFVQKLFGKNIALTGDVKRSLYLYGTIILPILFVAALIEVYLTPAIIELIYVI